MRATRVHPARQRPKCGRHASLGRRGRSTRPRPASTVKIRCDRSLGLAVDAPGRDHEQPPAVVVDRLPPVEVALPLVLALDVVAPVVLHDHPHARPGQVVAPDGRTVDVADRGVDLGFGQAREDDEHPQPRLHRRVDPVADPGRAQPGRQRRRPSPTTRRSRPAPRVVQSPRRTRLSPTTTRSTRLSRVASSTNICRGSETRSPRTTTTEADEQHVAARRRRVGVEASRSGPRRARAGDPEAEPRAPAPRSDDWRTPAPSKRSSAASTRRSGESGASAATETPRKIVPEA